MAFERKRKRNREIDRRRGRRRVAFFRVSRFFFSGSFWHGHQITWRQLRRIEEFFFSFDTIETGSEKRKKKRLNAIGERVCVCVVVSGSQLTRYRAKDSRKKMTPEEIQRRLKMMMMMNE